VQDLGDKPQAFYGQSTTWLDSAGRTLEYATAKGETALKALGDKIDVITTATPLAIVKEHWQKGTEPVLQYTDYFVGHMPGSLGEVSALLLLLGAAYLLIRGIITWHIPVSFLVGVALMAGITHLVNPTRYLDPVFHILTGGVIIGAFFMATDYVTSPTYPTGKIIFGLGCGVLTMLIRLWGGFPEGVSFAILLMNAVTPLIDRVTRPVKFGAKPWAEPEVKQP
jgi:electron transport complex protein RnfD